MKMHLHYIGAREYGGVKYHAWENCLYVIQMGVNPRWVVTDYDHFNMMTRGSWTLEDLGL